MSKQRVVLLTFILVIGAVVGGFLMGMLGQSGVTGFNLYSILVAVLGSVVVIYLGRIFRRTI